MLDGENMRETVLGMIGETIGSYVDMAAAGENESDGWNLRELNDYIRQIIPLPPITEEYIGDLSASKLKEKLTADAVALYGKKEEELTESGMDVREIERVLLLRSVDRHWMNHIDDMDQLRQGIGLAAYGQKDPKVMYKMEGYDMFNAMTLAIQEDTLKMMYHVKVQEKVEREEVAKVTGTNRDETSVRAPKKREQKKIYPNDPCWCGSGKKYKQCHMRQDAAK